MSRTMSARWAWLVRATMMGALFALIGPPAEASAQGVLLEGGEPGVLLQGNQFVCGLTNTANTCASLDDSPTVPGGSWPKGTPDAYMFNSGIMVAAFIDDDAAEFEWAGDTVGAYFFNASGGTHASPVTNVWNSLDPDDAPIWPQTGAIPEFPFLGAEVKDTALFSDVLLGRNFASQQDSWLVYWDGDPTITGNRDHPAGLLVEQRSLAWNYPQGNGGTIYFIYHITNVSGNEHFQELNENWFFGGENELPDEGWVLENVFMSYAADPDVSDAGANYASTILPFNMGIVYTDDFVDTDWVYPPAFFHPPFLVDGTGIIGTKYLKDPAGLGLTLFSVYTNGAPHSDPGGSAQLWRYLSGNMEPSLGDDPCTVTNPIERKVCFVNSTANDVRYFQASGPFSIDPGETVTIVSAMFAAPTVAGTVDQGGDNPPQWSDEPSLTPSPHPGCYDDPITDILGGSGWVSTPTCPAEGEPVDIFEVEVVRESLLAKAQVAQTIFDNKFLLPFAPEPPAFDLIPGEGQVTITWEPSETEIIGDPFYEVAGDPSSPLYNPNFRQFDVEGYRIYRSSDGVTFDLLAQVDFDSTVFIDQLCETDPNYLTGEPCTTVDTIPLEDRLVQYAPGDIVELAGGDRLVVEADTAPPLEFPNLADTTGVNYAYVDETARTGFQYYYRVTAFDINSLTSGPSSLESTSLPAQQVIPAPTMVSADSLENIIVAPDPYYGASLYDLGPAGRNLRFLNLPPVATIRIYTVSGVLVDIINHNSPTAGASLASWDLLNRSGQMVASGVYFYHVSTPEGNETIGKFTVVNSGLAN